MYHVNKAEVYKNYLVGLIKKDQVRKLKMLHIIKHHLDINFI